LAEKVFQSSSWKGKRDKRDVQFQAKGAPQQFQILSCFTITGDGSLPEVLSPLWCSAVEQMRREVGGHKEGLCHRDSWVQSLGPYRHSHFSENIYILYKSQLFSLASCYI
jgi:hypothetical protein